MASIKDQVLIAFAHDGKDHVNVFSYAATNVGKIASPEWRRKFYIPHLGEFASPRSFANWCVGGGVEALRHETGYTEYRVENLREFRALMLYAKFFQLTSMRVSLISDKHLLEVPWLMYKRHLTGVREDNKWSEYPKIMKAFCEHIVNSGNQTKFDFEAAVPGITNIVNKYVRAFVGEEFIGIDKIEELRTAPKEKKQDRPKKQRKERGQNGGVDTTGEPGFIENRANGDGDMDDSQPGANAHLKTTADAVRGHSHRPPKPRYEGLPVDEEQQGCTDATAAEGLVSEAKPLDASEYEARGEQLTTASIVMTQESVTIDAPSVTGVGSYKDPTIDTKEEAFIG